MNHTCSNVCGQSLCFQSDTGIGAACLQLMFREPAALLSCMMVVVAVPDAQDCRSDLVRMAWQVITKKVDGALHEPYEEAVVELPEEHVGAAVDLLGQRKGTMLDLSNSTGGLTRLAYRIPTRCGQTTE